jgi:uncharacterized protein (TIGR02646 family)
MIRLNLGAEPTILTTKRNECLPLAIAAFNSKGPSHGDFKATLDHGYQVARKALRHRQHGKCAFCEKSEDAFKRPTEHFRPKKGAQDKVNGKWQTVDTHYWWLTWTWENLFFACDQCNMTGNKGSRFPIDSGTQRVGAPVQPVSDPIPQVYYDTTGEHTLLVDPRRDDPLKHLRWIPVDRTKPRGTWTWTIDGRDLRGAMTIEVLGLTARIDEVNRHLAAIRLLWKQIENHLIAGRSQEAQNCWLDAVQTYVYDPKQPFRNAAWCALDSLAPHAERAARAFVHPSVPCVP